VYVCCVRRMLVGRCVLWGVAKILEGNQRQMTSTDVMVVRRVGEQKNRRTDRGLYDRAPLRSICWKPVVLLRLSYLLSPANTLTLAFRRHLYFFLRPTVRWIVWALRKTSTVSTVFEKLFSFASPHVRYGSRAHSEVEDQIHPCANSTISIVFVCYYKLFLLSYTPQDYNLPLVYERFDMENSNINNRTNRGDISLLKIIYLYFHIWLLLVIIFLYVVFVQEYRDQRRSGDRRSHNRRLHRRFEDNWRQFSLLLTEEEGNIKYTTNIVANISYKKLKINIKNVGTNATIIRNSLLL